MKLSAVRVFVRRLPAAKVFYADALGLALRHDASPYGYCLFDAGGTDFLVEAVAPEAPADEQALPGRFTGLSFAVADIQSAYQRLLHLGVRFDEPPERQFWGRWLATFVDPDGNRLQLAQAAR